MAKVRFASGITSIRGKFNGSQFSVSGSGAILQNKCQQRKGATTGQSLRRSGFSFLGRRWNSLSPAEKAANAAAAASYPLIDKFGNTYYLTGYQLLLRSNINLSTVELPPVNVVPAVPLQPVGFEWQQFVAGWYTTFDLTELYIAWGASTETPDFTVNAYVSYGQSSGLSVYNGVYPIRLQAPIINSEVLIQFPGLNDSNPFQPGQKIFIKAELIDNSTGVVVDSIATSAIVQII